MWLHCLYTVYCLYNVCIIPLANIIAFTLKRVQTQQLPHFLYLSNILLYGSLVSLTTPPPPPPDCLLHHCGVPTHMLALQLYWGCRGKGNLPLYTGSTLLCLWSMSVLHLTTQPLSLGRCREQSGFLQSTSTQPGSMCVRCLSRGLSVFQYADS